MSTSREAVRDPDIRADRGTRSPPVDAYPGTPLWSDYLIVVAVSAILSFGGFGLLLAVLGHFSVRLSVVFGIIGTIAGVILGRPTRLRPAPLSVVDGFHEELPRPKTLPALGACVAGAGVAIWNSVYIGHHVFVDSDPGVYQAAGRWLADHRSLIINGAAPWQGTGLTVNPGAAGSYRVGPDNIEFQFAHLLPVLLADVYRTAGAALMFRTPAIIGGLALCAVYAVGCRIIRRPWVVLAAVIALGVSLPEMSVSRDTLTEPVTQFLVWTGIWLLMRAYEERRAGVAALAGAAIGGTLMVHVDSVAYLVPLPLLMALAWIGASSPADRRDLARLMAWLLVGLIPPAVLGTIDVQRRSGTYYDDLHAQIHPLYAALGLSVLVAVAAVLLWPRVGPSWRWAVERRKGLGTVAGSIGAVALVLAWTVRPAGPKITGIQDPPIAALQRAQHLPVEATRTYAEQSMVWIYWYIGPIALALAIAGIALLAARVITTRSPRGLVVLAMTAPLTAIYLWRPSITPFQIWAMRRYVPVSLPLLLLASALAIDVAATWLRARRPTHARPRRMMAAGAAGIVLLGAAGMIAFSLRATLPVGRFQPQADLDPALEQTCNVVGPDGAVLFAPKDADVVLLLSVMSWCNVPTAQLLTPLNPQQLQTAAKKFQTEGKTLWVIASTPQALLPGSPAVTPRLIAKTYSPRQIRPTVSKPAHTYATGAVAIYGSPVSVSG